VGQPDAIHSRSSSGEYRTRRPTRRDGIDPSWVSVHNFRWLKPRSAAAARQSIKSGVGGGDSAVAMFRFLLRVLRWRSANDATNQNTVSPENSRNAIYPSRFSLAKSFQAVFSDAKKCQKSRRIIG
jgi:hypothetical protein